MQRLARNDHCAREVAVVDPHDAMRAVQRAGRLLRATCLAQSMALTTLLERDGQHPSLVLGCRRYGDNAWGAHAWVEVGTAVFEPVQAASHIELARLSAAGGWELRRADDSES